MTDLTISNVAGLPDKEQKQLHELLNVYNSHYAKNHIKDRYYEGNISLHEVNLGIALPQGMRGLEIGCAWGAKTVDVLASRSMFDGFVGANGNDLDVLRKICAYNNLTAEYIKACRDELKYGCTFATLSGEEKGGCRIRFHSPKSAAALWDGEKGRIGCGFAIIDSAPDELYKDTWSPSLINLYTDDAIWAISRKDKSSEWRAVRHPHRMGRPMMEPFIWNSTSDKPFGRSRIKEPVRRLIQGYVRTIANATIGLEFATAPQKYLLGVTDEQYNALVSQKFKQYVGNILASTTNPETGEKPTFGQLQQGNISPHVEMLRVLATQFSAATGLTVTDTGVVNDANPTSSDAILAQSQTLVTMAEQLNASNAIALKNIALMATAIVKKTTVENLADNEKDVMAHFKNPAMPSVASTADAAIKIASAREYFAQTDIFLEMVGFDQADIRRIKAQETRNRGLSILEELENGEDTAEGMGELHSEAEAGEQYGGSENDGVSVGA